MVQRSHFLKGLIKRTQPVPLEEHMVRIASAEEKYFALKAQVRNGTATLETMREMDSAFDEYAKALCEKVKFK